MKNLIIISAPSGSGKTTLCKALQFQNSSIEFSISCTTRPIRDNETNRVDYNFISKDNFKSSIANNEFVEWEKIHGDYYYGTLKSTLDDAIIHNKIILLELDFKGALSIKKLYQNKTMLIFIDPPTLDDLKIRLKKRGTESIDNINKRLDRQKTEIKYKSNFDHVVLNDSLDRAVKEILELIQKENKGVYHVS